MGVYLQSLKRNKTLNLNMVDGSTTTIAQYSYLCRAGQLGQTEWDYEKGDKLAHPEFTRAISRIENGLEKEPLHADYLSIDGVYKKNEIECAYLRKLKEGNPVTASQYDDHPSAVEDGSYIAIKTKEGFVILEADHQKVFDFVKSKPELWDFELPVSMWVRINPKYKATVYRVSDLYRYFTGHGKGEADRHVWNDRKPKGTPSWFSICIEHLCMQERKKFEEIAV